MSHDRTKIVCTIGPATNNQTALRALRNAGMNLARLNGSHANVDWHAETIALLRETVPDVPILLDIPGRKIRTASLAHEPSFEAGDIVVLTTDASQDGTRKVPIGSSDLHVKLSPNDTILADDGTLRFTVVEVDGQDIRCRAENRGTLRSRKGINVPHVNLGGALITGKDEEMVGFARANGVDFIGISFVESAEHVEAIRTLTNGTWPRIVSKVENQGGLNNVEEIANATDAIMIDRGDLSVETNFQEMAIFQKRILETARKFGKPVIVATEMLHSMIENPIPTKAEISDITNAVLDGCAAIMLSGETAIGKHPVDAVQIMRRVSDAANAYLHDKARTEDTQGVGVPKAIEDAIALISGALPISKIVAITVSGYAARMVASRRPNQPILAVTNDLRAAASFNLIAGVEGFHADIPFSKTSTDHIVKCLELLWRQRKITEDDLILVTAVGYPRSGNRMNLIETHQVADLKDALGWT